MPQFYPEHFYLWGYAGISLAAFLSICIGALHLTKRCRAVAIRILIAGALAIVGGRCFADIGWLVVSEGSGGINCIEKPHMCKMFEQIRVIEYIASYLGVLLLAIAIPLLSRHFLKHKEATSSAEQHEVE